MTVRLFIGNLPYNVTEAELKEHFSTVGPVSYVSLPTDRETGKVRGFAFLEFSERAHAEEAVRRFNSQNFKGRPLVVNEARAREDRPRGSGPSSAPSPVRSPLAPRPGAPESGARTGEAGSNFGPDAPPRNRMKSKGHSRTERVPKGPLREVSRGRYFGGDEDDEFSDDELSDDNFASRIEDGDDLDDKDDENT